MKRFLFAAIVLCVCSTADAACHNRGRIAKAVFSRLRPRAVAARFVEVRQAIKARRAEGERCYAEQLTPLVVIYRSDKSGEIVGCKINGVKSLVMEARCLKAFDDGERTTLREEIEKLRARIDAKQTPAQRIRDKIRSFRKAFLHGQPFTERNNQDD